MDFDFLFFSGCTNFPLCGVLGAHMSAIYSFGCPDLFIWHNPVGNFIWADIMYLSASHIPLPLSKYAIISSQLTLLNTSNHFYFYCSLRSRSLHRHFLLLYNICLSASLLCSHTRSLSYIRIAFAPIICMLVFVLSLDAGYICTSTRYNPPVDYRLPGHEYLY